MKLVFEFVECIAISIHIIAVETERLKTHTRTSVCYGIITITTHYYLTLANWSYLKFAAEFVTFVVASAYTYNDCIIKELVELHNTKPIGGGTGSKNLVSSYVV